MDREIRILDCEIIEEVVNKLVGNIHAIGSTHIDQERFKNLSIHAALTSSMVQKLCDEVQLIRCHEYSMKLSGEVALETLKAIKELIDEYCNRYGNNQDSEG